MIALPDFLISNNKVNSYFNDRSREKWIRKYTSNCNEKILKHDEPWLTLIAAYSIFGDLSSININNIKAFNSILQSSGMKNSPPIISSILEIKVEKDLPAIREYCKHLHDTGNYHLYPDRIGKIKERIMNGNNRFEGSTQVDLYIKAQSEEKTLHFIIESKFLSDISYQITYNPFRDQIARNIDNGISQQKTLNEDFYFLLLTPKAFRTNSYGGNGDTLLTKMGADRSRLYCYKMDDYRDPDLLKAALPHRSDEMNINWNKISGNIGWISFEDICKEAIMLSDKNEKEMIEKFFSDRNLL